MLFLNDIDRTSPRHISDAHFTNTHNKNCKNLDYFTGK